MTSHKAKYVPSSLCPYYTHFILFTRSFFKKWLDLERRLGDEEGADAVKEKAVEWTQKAAAAAS
jgi:hypothetical protein